MNDDEFPEVEEAGGFALIFKWNFNVLDEFVSHVNTFVPGAANSPELPSWLRERPPAITCESITTDIVRQVAGTQGPSLLGVVAIADDLRRMITMRERLSAMEAHPLMQRGMETAGATDRLATILVMEIGQRPRRLVASFADRSALGDGNRLIFA